ncbi:MAG: hypothetical protein ACP5R5_03235, partial [Armatimonadota bacterium]
MSIAGDISTRTRLPRHTARIGAMLALIILACAACGARASSRLVLVVAGNISIRDIALGRLPHLDKLLREGSCGLMNVRTGRPSKLVEPADAPGMEAGCLAIGAGAMATGGAEVRRAAGAGTALGLLPAHSSWPWPRASDVYMCRTAKDAGRAEIVHLEIEKMHR